VIGATGCQGGSVVSALLKDNLWKIRAVTRDLQSEKAKELINQGVEVIQCDVTGKSFEHIFKDAYGAFLVTDCYDESMKGKELEVGKRLVDAAKDAGVQHLIWSSLPNVQRLSKDKYNVPAFTDKGLVEEYIRDLQNSKTPAFTYATYFGPAFYYQNFLNFFPPKREGENYYFKLPETSSINMFDVRDTGNVVAEILRNPLKTNGKYIAASAFQGKLKEVFKILENTSGYKIKLEMVKPDDFAKSKHEHAQSLAQMFAWFNAYGYYGPDISTDGAKSLGVHLTPFEEWVKNDFKLELEQKPE